MSGSTYLTLAVLIREAQRAQVTTVDEYELYLCEQTVCTMLVHVQPGMTSGEQRSNSNPRVARRVWLDKRCHAITASVRSSQHQKSVHDQFEVALYSALAM